MPRIREVEEYRTKKSSGYNYNMITGGTRYSLVRIIFYTSSYSSANFKLYIYIPFEKSF